VGLRARLTLIITLGLGLSFVASLVLLARVERRSEHVEAAERAGALLHTLSVPVALDITQGRVPDLDNLMSELDQRKEALDIAELLLLDHNGVVLTHSDSDRFGTNTEGDVFLTRAIASPVPLVERLGGVPSRVAVPVQTGIRWGTLVGTLSKPAIDRRVAQTQLRLVIIALTVSALGLLTLLVIVSVWVVRPIQALSDAAHAFAEGDTEARAPVGGGGEIAFLAQVLNNGAERLSTYTSDLQKAVDERTEELAATNEELRAANERLEKLAITDGLTGLINHRHFHELLDREIARQKRSRKPFAVVMADVDHFKTYNDTHGHPAGDEVLKQVARLLSENVRETDVVGRYGGEEFILLLLETSVTDAFQRADALRNLIATYPFAHRRTQPLGRLSVSMGVAVWPDDGVEAQTLVSAADVALYQSKRNGRDRVTNAAQVKLDDEEPQS
jgi:diguanylate cyclase (GGDEF)-like protein